MNILMLQTDIAWQSPGENRAAARCLIEGAVAGRVKTDLVILPEMFTTGFCTAPEGVAEKDGAETLDWMRAVAKQTGAAIAGSVAVEENGLYYNRFYFVRPDGSHDFYDKRHLFTYAGENVRYTAGGRRVVVEWRGVRILLQVCYDLRFPVFSRNRGDYDMIIYLASWPGSRIGAWNTLLKARAVENACYVTGVNRAGKDPNTSYNGSSMLVDYKGELVSEADTERQAAFFGKMDMDALRTYRDKFPVLGDADDFSIKI